VDYAFRRCLARNPNEKESAALLECFTADGTVCRRTETRGSLRG